VDDSKTVRLMVGRAFKKFDCIVLEAANGADGLAVAAREKPDVILLDYTMPVLDGLDMVTQLISDPELKAIPVVMLTALSGRETLAKMASLGVRDYMLKPFKEDALVQRIGRIVPLTAKAQATPGGAAVAETPEFPRNDC
jgi:two-component system cell cycle response regulator